MGLTGILSAMTFPICRRIVGRGTIVALASAGSVIGAIAAAAEPVAAPIVAPDSARPTAVSYGPQTVARLRVGAKIAARGGAVTQIHLLVAVPLECAEQEVELVEEDSSPHVGAVEFRDSDEGVRQMVIEIPELAPRQEAHAYATFEIRTRTIVAPKETATLVAPKKPARELKRYLAASPFIDVNHRKIRAAIKAALAAQDKPVEHSGAAGDTGSAGDGGDWRRVEAMYDYALAQVKYKDGLDDKSAVQALTDGEGDCQSIAAVFVAMCRTAKIPARMVWVDGHQYAEFYLEDAAGEGCWYPVESAGTRAFGEMPIARVILQKGDNFRIPELGGQRRRYASDHATALSQPGREPKVTFVREQMQ
jgi:hypothetical protein